MKRLVYQVCLGAAKYSKLYEHCMQSVRDYCGKHDIDYHCQTEAILRMKPDVFMTDRSPESYEKHGGFLPIYEKENAFDWFTKGYHQIAIIDADIYIRPDAPNIFDDLDHTFDFGGVVERSMPITGQYAHKITNYSHMQYGQLRDVDWDWRDWGAKFYNMGMMVLNRSITDYLHGESAQQFIRRGEFKRFVDGLGPWKWSTDQTLLNWWVKKEQMRVKDMDWKWNALYSAVKDDRISEAHFVHFFLKDKLPEQGENVEALMEKINK